MFVLNHTLRRAVTALAIGNVGKLVQVHDDLDAIQATPDELPVIDIHSL